MPHLPAGLKGRRSSSGSPRRAQHSSPCALHPPRRGHLSDPEGGAGDAGRGGGPEGSLREGTPVARDTREGWDRRGGAGGGRRARTLSRAQRSQRGRLRGGGRGGAGAPRRAVPGTRPPRALGGPGAVRRRRLRGAAGRVLPVDLERERAPLRARQRGHGPRAARPPLGARGADGGDPARRGAAAAHAERGASLICQRGCKLPHFHLRRRSHGGGGPSLGAAAAASPASHPAPGPARRERRARGCGHAAELPSGCSERRRAAAAGALTSGRSERGRRAPRPPGQAGNSICPEPRGCQRLRAGAGTRCPPAPRAPPGREASPARLGAGPSEGSAPSLGGGAGAGGGRFENTTNQPTDQGTNQLLQKMCPLSFLGHLS